MIIKKSAIALGSSLGVAGTTCAGVVLLDPSLVSTDDSRDSETKSADRNFKFLIQKGDRKEEINLNCPNASVTSSPSEINCMENDPKHTIAWKSIQIYNVEKSKCKLLESSTDIFSCDREEIPK
ncbi:hypothetical protein MHLP_03090 [Candidatus Mycoplasma haematolamae str. Purdue]|uniref:Lipoprotein n=1 Tax=Mycoplasma haematolamae (strain Purdue) TaxID=1212765 RepID=I7BK01_MYCHA|nr:hypothetical protein [Candidatus Mycoplasma haematolamae]AFO52198.1 hypothetical protein MHLP_03090 [Candidatus Mycoplasma haematolamae str. Purdue]